MPILIFSFQALSLIYPLVGLFFYFEEQWLGTLLGFEASPPGLWLSLTVSMMFMLGYCAWQTARVIKKNIQDKTWFVLHLISKGTSVLFFILSFVSAPHLFYGIGACVDGAIFILVLLSMTYYFRGTKS